MVIAGIVIQAGLLRLEGRWGGASPRAPSGDEKRYLEVATAWSQGNAVELDPLWPPGYPGIVAAALAAGGSLELVVALQFLALAAAGLALGRIARRLGASDAAAALAGAWLLLDPGSAVFARLYRPEAFHLALLLWALLWAIELSVFARAATGGWRPPALGAALGLAIALKSLLLPFLPLFFWQVVRAAPRGERLRRGLLALLPCLALLAGVAAFHRQQCGSWTLGGSARFNLWVGLNDRGERSLAEDRTWDSYLEYRAGGSTFAERQAALGQRLGELVRLRGLWSLVVQQFPRQYRRLFDRESYFAAMLPPAGSRFIAGEGYREAPPVLARVFGGLELGLYGGLLALAPFGLVRLWRAQQAGASWIGALLAGQLALFWIVHVKSRYRLTLLPLLILGAATAIEALWRPALRRTIAGIEIVLGVAGAALLGYFAFGAS